MAPGFSALRASFGVILLLAASAGSLFGYALEGPSWPAGSTINQHLAFTGPGSDPLQDGLTTFNASAADALNLWNQQMQLAKFAWTTSSVGGIQGDRQNTAVFSATVYGQTYGSALAVTIYFFEGSTMKEVDNVFNSALFWDSYRGPLQYNSRKKQYTYDFHRVALHEFGHTLGLAHPDEYGQPVSAIMNSHISDLDHLADDDIAGIRWLYGLRVTSEVAPYQSPVGESFSYQITGNDLPTSFGATGLPAGLSVNSASGLISGKPTVSGTFNVNVTATGSQGTATGVVTLTISAPAFTNLIGLPTWVGNPFSFRRIATSQPTGYDAAGLPNGLQIDHETGVIHGQLILAGDFSIQVTAHTPYGDGTGILSLHVFPPAIRSSTFLDDVFTGSPLSYQIAASTSQATYSAIGLPPGLSVDSSTGNITGIPTLSGMYSVVVIAHTPYGDARGNLSFTLTPPADPPDVQLPIGAQVMLADAIRSRLYLKEYSSGNIAVFDVNSLSTIGTLPTADSNDFCLSADNTKLWASYYSRGSIVGYDLTTFSAVRTLFPSVYVGDIREGSGEQMYINEVNNASRVSRLDLNSGTVSSVPWPGEAGYIPLMEVSADHKTLFVGDIGAPSTLAKYDVSSGSPVLAQFITQPDWGRNIIIDLTSKRFAT
ncbi:MAG: hypothetical protein DMF04_11820 [Verrucomicrobia bacterium]|nr:MAG: hypothetical protein DMF04_11820 [Verrucomicrobiota bacterium]